MNRQEAHDRGVPNLWLLLEQCAIRTGCETELNRKADLAIREFTTLLDALATVTAERDKAREALALAAMEINCAGPVHERIRVLRRELQERIEAVTAERDEWQRKFFAEQKECAEFARHLNEQDEALSRAEAMAHERDAVYALGKTPTEQSNQIPLSQWVQTRFVHVEEFNALANRAEAMARAVREWQGAVREYQSAVNGAESVRRLAAAEAALLALQTDPTADVRGKSKPQCTCPDDGQWDHNRNCPAAQTDPTGVSR